MTDRERLIQQARNFLFVREVGGPNKGLWVGIFQRFVGIDEGQSWCAAFVCFVLAIILGGRDKLPFGVTGVCEVIHQWAIKNDRIVPLNQALPGDLYLFVTDEGHAHHVGILTVASPMLGLGDMPRDCGVLRFGIAGNTSADGLSSNGDRVAEHTLNVAPNHIIIVRVLQ